MFEPYRPSDDGIWRPPFEIAHHEDDYDPQGFPALARIQKSHFWFQGRHRFLLHAYRQIIVRSEVQGRALGAIDLGGGCGGWLRYLAERLGDRLGEIALADSSPEALRFSRGEIPPRATVYQIDLQRLLWSERWDFAFLLDVLEHVDDDAHVLRQIRNALRPGGYLFITTPALERFRTPIDDMSHHVRRYSRRDFDRLAGAAGLDLVRTRYFMFFLSPLLWIARRRLPPAAGLSKTEIRRLLDESDKVPPAPINMALAAIFSAETPLGAWLPFPWGTSVLAVLRRPLDS
jgi:SAM-dependent methyltransferase